MIKKIILLLVIIATAIIQGFSQNIAQGKTAAASSETQVASNAVDGDMGTRWESSISEPEWISIDLGASYDIGQVILKWEGAFGEEYTIDVSANNVDWTTIKTVVGGNGGTDDLSVTGTGRYIRMNGTKRGSPWAFSLWEFEVYEAVDITADATLSDLKVDATTINGFSSSVLEYTYDLEVGTTTVPTVTATATNNGGADVTITPAAAIPGTTTIVVESEDASATKTYKVNFVESIPVAAAPTPTNATVDVISVYSDAYTSIATNLNPGWGQSTVFSEVQLQSNNTLKYKDLTFQGTEYTNPTDVSGMEYVHFDYWTYDATVLEFFLIAGGENSYNVATELGITTSTWVGVDIPLTYYSAAGRDLANAFQFKTQGNGTVYIDNMYFWKQPTVAGADATLSDLKVGGVTIDGFSKNTELYNYALLDNASTIPTVAATATDDGNASVGITQASTPLPDTAVVLVTAQNGTTTKTYKVAFAATIPSAAAPTPTKNASDVQAVFSDAYSVINDNPSWPWTTVSTVDSLEVVSLDTALVFTPLNQQIIEFGETDLSAMEYLHIDYITYDDEANVNFAIYSTGVGDSKPYNLANDGSGVVAGSWQSIDIPLSHYSNADLSKVTWVKTSGTGDKIYIDNVYFWKNPTIADASLSDLTIDGTTVDGFAANTLEYDVELPVGTGTIPTVAATTKQSTPAAAVVTAATSLPGTTTVVVTAQDGSTTKTYKVNFTVDKGNIADGKTTAASSGTNHANAIDGDILTRWESAHGADPQWISIDLGQSYDIDKVVLKWEGAYAKQYTIDVSDDNTTWTTAYTETDSDGETDELCVTASARYIRMHGTVRATNYGYSLFEFEVYEALPTSADATLNEITVGGQTVVEFCKHNLSYSVELPYGTTNAPTVTATTSQVAANATVTAASTIPGATTIDVEAEQTVFTQTYTVNFTLAANTDATLSDIKVNDISIAGFDPATLTYEAVLPIGTTAVPNVTATATDATGATVQVTAAPDLQGATTILVTAADGTTTKTYTVTFAIAKSDDATLSDLQVNGESIAGFKSDSITYNVELPFGTTTVPTVTATATNSGNAVVSITDAASVPGTTTVLVTAEDETTTQTYTINFTIASGNNDASLSDLLIDGVTVSGFKADSLAYEFEIPFGTTIFPTVTYVLNSASASAVQVKATSLTKTDTITVTAQDGTVNKYTVKFVLAAPSNDATLSDLALDGTTISGFKADSVLFPVELPFGTTDVPEVTAIATHDSAVVVITQAATLNDTAIAVVTAQDGTTVKTYKVSFTVAKVISSDATLQNIKVDGLSLADFVSDKYLYAIELPFGTTAVPNVQGVKNNLAATVVTDTAKTLADTTVITVTAQDGITILHYKVAFIMADPVYDVTFVVSDGAKGLLKGAQVTFLLDTLTTDINGEATFTQVSVTTSAAYSVTLEGYEDVTGKLSVVDANVTKEITMTLKTYDVKFNVVDAANEAIAMADVVFINDTVKTDSAGLAVFNKIAPITDAVYEVSKTGYFKSEGIISVVDSTVVTNVVLSVEAYEVKFTVIDEDSLPVAIAQVVFNNDTVQTDSSGMVAFTSIIPNDTNSVAYVYMVSKEGYFTATDSISVIDTAIDVNVMLEKELYDVTFTVVDNENNAVSGAQVVFQKDTVTTSDLGLALFAKIAPVINAEYSVVKEGFVDASGMVTVAASMAIEVELESIASEAYMVSFTVVDGENNPVENAEVIFVGDTLSTDINGLVVFEQVTPATEAEYLVSKEGFEVSTGAVSVIDADVDVEVQLIALSIKNDMSLVSNIYPNPTYGAVNIELQEAFNTASVKIYNAQGQIVMSKEIYQMHTMIHLTDMESGIYFVNLNIDNNNYVGRIIKR